MTIRHPQRDLEVDLLVKFQEYIRENYSFIPLDSRNKLVEKVDEMLVKHREKPKTNPSIDQALNEGDGVYRP